ncbi:putative C6 transcription factor [Aspergillus fijiensis CBS 313.89]|uniref:C6 transcription factor n=1 Tax=Aspergillus fijiensis CBS 313.89 TaxID=1448319 RepID=A0A8G1RDF0_9EURO|nr:C6 transcription factor [Aspergillus fijiensis CBS 313.89]RAK71240.1 C6 transcription factor [Aspergillus fijiensis CBS 313.89]
MDHNHLGRTLPTLAPGPRGAFAAPVTTIAKSRKNSTACTSCKAAKRKCSGRPAPCKACQTSKVACVFDESLDLRRKVAVRRTQGELQHYKGLLASLFNKIRDADEAETYKILEAIRCNEFEDIATALEGLELPSTEESSSDSSSSSEDSESEESEEAEDDSESPKELSDPEKTMRLTIERLCDTPLYQVPSYWTYYDADDFAVSHLVSLYFTWDHPFSQILDQDSFLFDMGDPHFCTSLLVSSILAVAATYSDYPKICAIRGIDSTRGQNFFEEAERLWKAERGRPTLANIQAVTLMSRFLQFQGQRQASWLMLKQAVQLAKDIGLFHSPRRHWGSDMPAKTRHVYAVAAWGLYIMNSEMSFERGKAPDLEPPWCYPDTAYDNDKGVVWSAYPRFKEDDFQDLPAQLGATFNRTILLAKIAVRIQEFLFIESWGMSKSEIEASANDLMTQLQVVKEGLPASEVEQRELPHVLLVHIKYHHTVLLFFEHLWDHQLVEATPEQARSYRLEPAKKVVEYLGVFEARFGLRRVPRQMLEPANRSLLALLVFVEDEESWEPIIDLCRFMAACSTRFVLAEQMCLQFERLIKASNAVLPQEAYEVLKGRGINASDWL